MRGGFLRAYVRLLFVQASWNYERMTGVGLGHAATPLLEDLESVDPTRHAEAMVRSAEYFNSHPYLAGLALGAVVRAEYDQVPGVQISRLRTALTSPLGALGDQFFWVGAVPVAIGLAVTGVAFGLGEWAILASLFAYGVLRFGTGAWALRTGLSNGARVGAALGSSWLPRLAPIVGYASALIVGIAVPVAVVWLLGPLPRQSHAIAAVTLPVAVAAVWKLSPRVTTVRFALGAIGLTALVAWGLP
jgi:PTS system mannose-specific IID component